MWKVRRIALEPDLPENFRIGAVRIRKRDARDYVVAKGRQFFGQSFFYAYVYRDGLLRFLVVAEDGQYRKGLLPILHPVLLSERGAFYIKKEEGAYLVFEVEEDRIATKVEYVPRGENLVGVELPKRIPGSLVYSWSLEYERGGFKGVALGFFLASLVFYSLTFVSGIFRQDFGPVRPVTMSVQDSKKAYTPNLAFAIRKVIEKADGLRYVESARKTGDFLEFVLVFRDRAYASEFINREGGEYEKGKIIYRLPFPFYGGDDTDLRRNFPPGTGGTLRAKNTGSREG